METVIVVVHVIVAIAIVGLVLLQQGKGLMLARHLVQVRRKRFLALQEVETF